METHMHKKCHQCGLAAGKQYIRAEGLIFHPDCFQCKHCHQRVQGEYVVRQGFVYHPACAPGLLKKIEPLPVSPPTQVTKPLFCTVCQGQLTGKYLYNHWGETAHPQHQGKTTHQCSTCHRFLSATTQQGIQYGDGRIVCGLCQMTAVTAPDAVEPSRRRVLQMLNTVGFSYIPDYLSIILSDQRRLNQSLKKRAHANSHGLTKTVEKSVNGVVQYREHSIFILYGLPRIVFEGVLAHELLHVWLNEQPNTRERTPQEIEGFCNLGTACMYQQEDTPLSHYLLERMHKDTDAVYGEGYRMQHQRLTQIGWDKLREQMQRPAPFKNALKTVDRWLDRFNL
jgi:hypothetical protein